MHVIGIGKFKLSTLDNVRNRHMLMKLEILVHVQTQGF